MKTLKILLFSLSGVALVGGAALYWLAHQQPWEAMPVKLPVTVAEQPLDTEKTVAKIPLQLRWHSEFNDSAELDQYWMVQDGPRRGGVWRSDAVSVEEGRLVIKTFYDAERGQYVDGAIISRDSDNLYGYYSARMRLPKKSGGHWGAFWIWNPPFEIDVMEQPFRQGVVKHSLHWYAPVIPKAHEERGHYVSSPRLADSGWHTYSLLWTPEFYAWYIDGVETLRISADEVLMADAPGAVIISDEINAWQPVTGGSWFGVGDIRDALTLPELLEVDWVRVYDLQ